MDHLDKHPVTNSEATTLSPPQPPDTKQLQTYIHAATSDNTRKTYRSAIRQYEQWGGYLPTDAPTLLRYLLEKAEHLNPRTLDLHLTAIAQWHRTQSLRNPVDDPKIRKVMEGIRRTHGRPKQKAKALRLEQLAAMVAHLQSTTPTLKQQRDLVLLLVGYFGGFRRSELVSIEIRDLQWEPGGVLIHLRRSKTDQSGEGQIRALPFARGDICPGKAIKKWLEKAKLTSGPLLRPISRWGKIKDKPLTPGSVNDVLKSLGRDCHFDFVPDLSSHSFRRGLSTSAAREGVDFELIKKQGGWKSDTTVWGYIEEGKLLDHNAATPLMEKLVTIVDGIKKGQRYEPY